MTLNDQVLRCAEGAREMADIVRAIKDGASLPASFKKVLADNLDIAALLFEELVRDRIEREEQTRWTQ